MLQSEVSSGYGNETQYYSANLTDTNLVLATLAEENTINFGCESGYGCQDFIKPYLVFSPLHNEGFSLFESNHAIFSQMSSDIKFQLEKLFWGFNKSLTVINKEETTKFLLDLQLDIGSITDQFLEANKVISSKFPKEEIKLFIEKYDDPETKDHFIAIYVRKKSYSEDFIDKIWDIREIFSKQFPENDWILITTDYEPFEE